MPDTAYAITRRKGRRLTVSLQGTSTADPETLERTEARVVVNLRRVVVEPTKYARLMRAKAVAQDIGETTLIFWRKDITFDRVTPEDYAIIDGKRYNFIESTIEDTGLVATAREVTGQIANQTITASASDTMLGDSTNESVTP